MSLEEYLTQSSRERSAELEANVTHHLGFSGGIDEYLHGTKTKPTNTMQASNTSPSNRQTSSGTTTMSMDEYQAKTNNSSHSSSSSSGSYHGDIDGYLAKFGNGGQTPMKKQSADPFDEKEHMGFHGSYEEYAKKYN